MIDEDALNVMISEGVDIPTSVAGSVVDDASPVENHGGRSQVVAWLTLGFAVGYIVWLVIRA